MKQVQLLPRLSRAAVRRILETHAPNYPPPLDKRAVNVTPPDAMTFGSSGGARSIDAVFEIGSELRKIVLNLGSSNAQARSRFDHSATAYLGAHEALQGGEALRNDTWAFLTTIVAPNVVRWRFPKPHHTRFEGGVRNAFQRLWLRARALDRGVDHPDRWGLVRELPEDAVVAIIERTSIGARHAISLALGEGWSRMARVTPAAMREDIMRLATKFLLLENQIADLASLTNEQLEQTVDHRFAVASRQLGVESQVGREATNA